MLHAAAREVVRKHGGQVPREAEVFGALPGVGRYTTGAVLSIAYDRPLAVLDGNVARVLSRIEALPLAVKRPRDARALWARAAELVDATAPGDWNQALMELGATVCTPRTPRCDACPVRRSCRALALKRVEAFPPVPSRRETERVRRAVALVARGDRVLMTQREGALLAGLWEPPGVELERGVSPRVSLTHALAKLGVRVTLARTDEVVRHTITHRRIEVEVWRGALDAGPTRTPKRARWVDPARPEVAITALAGKLGRLGAASGQPSTRLSPSASRSGSRPRPSRRRGSS
jgi:A/G-specific adenine glycosylase